MATDTRNPTSDDAVSGTWTGSAGTRYTAVDDYPDSGGADSLTCSAAGTLTFGFSAFSIPSNATSISVAVKYYDQKSGSQAAANGARLKVGGTYYNATTHNPANATWTTRTDTWATNPKSGAAWTVDDINGVGSNALQAFGFNVTDASPSNLFASVQIEVTYTASSTYNETVTETVTSSDGTPSGPKTVAEYANTGNSTERANATERASLGGDDYEYLGSVKLTPSNGGSTWSGSITVTAGETVLVGTGAWPGGGSAPTASCSDGTNTYTPIVDGANGWSSGGWAYVWKADNVAAGTYTLTVTASTAMYSVSVQRYKGLRAGAVQAVATFKTVNPTDDADGGNDFRTLAFGSVTPTSVPAMVFGFSSQQTDSMAEFNSGRDNFTARDGGGAFQSGDSVYGVTIDCRRDSTSAVFPVATVGDGYQAYPRTAIVIGIKQTYNQRAVTESVTATDDPTNTLIPGAGNTYNEGVTEAVSASESSAPTYAFVPGSMQASEDAASGTQRTLSISYSEGESGVVLVSIEHATAGHTISDGTNTYDQIASTITYGGAARVAAYVCQNPKPGSYTLTSTWDTAGPYRKLGFAKYQGLVGAQLSASFSESFNTVTGVDQLASTAVTPTAQPAGLIELAFNGYNAILTAGTEFSGRGTMFSANGYVGQLEDRRLTATSAVSGKWTDASGFGGPRALFTIVVTEGNSRWPSALTESASSAETSDGTVVPGGTTYNESATEAASSAESASAVATKANSLTEAASSAESSSASNSIPTQTVTEAATSAESASATATKPEAITEAASASDGTPTTFISKNETVNESVSAVDSTPAVTFTAVSSAAESVSAAESATSIATMASSLTEAVTATESATEQNGKFEAVAEAATTAESSSAANSIPTQSITEPATAAEAATAVATKANSVTETGSASDGTPTALTGVKAEAVTESGSAAESCSASIVAASGLSEGASASESASGTSTIAHTVSEAVATAEAASAGAVIARSVSESVSSVDAAIAAITKAEAVAETLAAADAFISSLIALGSVTEGPLSPNDYSTANTPVEAMSESVSAADFVFVLRNAVSGDDRVLDIPAELRSFDVQAENRTLAVPVENRTVAVPAEVRSVTS